MVFFREWMGKIKKALSSKGAGQQSNLIYIKDEKDYTHLNDRDLYQKLYNEVGEVEANKEIKWRDEWMKYFKPRGNSKILELGAHNGPNLIYYSRLGHVVHGVEISETLIETFNKFIIQEPVEVQNRVKIFKEWIENFQSEDRYDYVLCTEILEHVADPLKILSAAKNHLKQDGEIYISSPSTHWGNNTHVRGVPAHELKLWLEKTGINISRLWEEDNRTFCIAHVN